ncbi:MAG: S-layer homology domain-containing protein [Clostridiales bacterium]|nr:S-layer homology domain-containing protein [Clostridiales bacterium]
MKKIHRVLWATILGALLCVSALVAPALAFYSDGPSDWARGEVRAAIDSGLPDWETENLSWATSWTSAAYKNEYPEPISRVDFCHLIGRILAKDKNLSSSRLYSEAVNAGYRSPFSDMTRVIWNYDAFLANSLGIIEGVSEETFDPFGTLTREQAAVILAKTIIAIRPSLRQDTTDYTADKTITDRDEISSRALNYIGFVIDQGVMRGTGNGAFAPREPFTVEQAMVTCYRLCRRLELPGMIPTQQANLWLDTYHMNREYEFLARQSTGNHNDGYVSVYYGGTADGISAISVGKVTVDGIGELNPATDAYLPEDGYPVEEYKAELHVTARNMQAETFYTAHVNLTLTMENGQIQQITDTFVFLY